MNTPKWLIEHIFDDDIERLTASLKLHNIEYKIASNPSYDGQWHQLFNQEEDCVICYGSIQFGDLVIDDTQYTPGILHTSDRTYDCSTYYPHFNEFLLNRPYVMLPYAELQSHKQQLYEWVGVDDVIFIRPNTGKKTFTGTAVYKERFERAIALFDVYEPDYNGICLISAPQNITREWRFFIVDGVLVTGSLYRQFSVGLGASKYQTIDINKFNLAACFAQKVLDNVEWRPDRVWCLDVCQVASGNYYVLEIGSASAAGLYACDTDLLVPEINRVALEEFNRGNVV